MARYLKACDICGRAIARANPNNPPQFCEECARRHEEDEGEDE